MLDVNLVFATFWCESLKSVLQQQSDSARVRCQTASLKLKSEKVPDNVE